MIEPAATEVSMNTAMRGRLWCAAMLAAAATYPAVAAQGKPAR
jgi:hypothetical protein